MIPQGYEITGDMVPRVRNILGVPDRRDAGLRQRQAVSIVYSVYSSENFPVSRCFVLNVVSSVSVLIPSFIYLQRGA